MSQPTSERTDRNHRPLSWREFVEILAPLQVILPLFRQHQARAWVAIAFLLLASGATLMLPPVVRSLINDGFAAPPILFDSRFLFLIGVLLAQAIFGSLRHYAVMTLGESIVYSLRTAIFRHLLSLDAAFYDRTHTGELLSRLASDTTQIKSTAGSSASLLLRNSCLFMGATVMMIVTSPHLAFLAILGLPVVFVPLLRFGGRVKGAAQKVQNRQAVALAITSDMISAVREVQVGGMQTVARNWYARAQAEARHASFQAIGNRAFLFAALLCLGCLCIAGIFWQGKQMVADGTLSAGDLGQFSLYAIIAATSLATLGQGWGDLVQAAGALSRIADLLRTRPTLKPCPKPQVLGTQVAGRIEFESVGFFYPTDPNSQVLTNISFTIHPGERVALVGRSGAGKSTILQLLLRLYDPTSGQIRLDGLPLYTLDPSSFHRQVAYVSQTPAIFANTVEANVALGGADSLTPDADTTDWVWRALKAADAEPFVTGLPDGIATPLGDHGTGLSTGQRQRIAIARSIFRRAPILVYDEPTSALDPESEARILAGIEREAAGKTLIMTSHRLAAMPWVDRIVVIDRGCVVEQGSFRDLLDNAGLFSTLYRHQLRAGEHSEAFPSPA